MSILRKLGRVASSVNYATAAGRHEIAERQASDAAYRDENRGQSDEFRAEVSQRQRDFDTLKETNSHKLKVLKEKGKYKREEQLIKEEYGDGDESSAGSLMDKGLARKELSQVRFNHIVGALCSGAISNAYWAKLVFMGAAVTASYDLPAWQIWIVVTLATVGSFFLVFVIERTKYFAQMDSRVTAWSYINLTVVGISILTSVGSLLDTQQGAEKMRRDSSQTSIDSADTAKAHAKKWELSNWINNEAINKPADLANERQKYMNSPALNSNGAEMSKSNNLILGGRKSGANYDTAKAGLDVIDKKIQARRDFDSVVNLVNINGSPKASSGGGGGGTEDALASAISRILKGLWIVAPTVILMIITFIVIIGLEVVGAYNGKRRIRLQQIVNGQDEQIMAFDIAAASKLPVTAVQGMIASMKSMDSIGAPQLAGAGAGASSGADVAPASAPVAPSAVPSAAVVIYGMSLEDLNKRKEYPRGVKCRSCDGAVPHNQSTYCVPAHGVIFRKELLKHT